jgi:serine/threonine-protein kinase
MADRIKDGEEADATQEYDVTQEYSEESAPTVAAGVGSGSKSAAPPPPADGGRRFEPGVLLAERYKIVRRLGKGGMGEVFLADDLKLDQPVALKFLPAELETDEVGLKVLFDEIKVARKISHPNACRVFDLGEAEGVHFLSMEYIDGEDLSSLLARIGRLPLEKAIELGMQTCEGLAAIHEAGILHRDLKPANLMIDGQGRAKITDFGLAALSESISGAAVSSGTPAYMAPEQFAGTEVSVQSDIYALGLLLYELFTGHRVFVGSSLVELMKMHRETAPKTPSEWVDSFDPAVERIILQCLEKDPETRPASVRDVARALSGDVDIEEGTQLRTLLMSRLENRTRLVETLGDRASTELFAAHDAMVHDLLRTHEGREIDKGDGFLLLFDRPWQAVRFALAYHRQLASQQWERGVELSARVGIHLGEVLLRKSTRQEVARGARPLEVEGLAKPTASRLRSLARGGQTLLTGAAFDLARRGAVGETGETEGLSWLAHGPYLFEGAEQPVEVFEVGVEELAPLQAPGESSVATKVEAEDTILGWRPASGMEIPYRSNWETKQKLGEGGFGEVWLGEHKKTGEQRVYKFCYEAERLRSLQREITLFRLLKEELGLREDIVRILDWNLDEAPYFIELAYVDGGSLVDWAESQGGIGEVPLADRLEIVAQVATALAAAHSVGVLHKDIKPGNVLMTRDSEGRPKAVLTDFGIGLVTDTQRLAAKGITVLGLTELDAATGTASTAGTQLYMAPELMTGQPSTIQADIYALGSMLYQMVVGDLDRPVAQGWQRQVEDELLREDIAVSIDGDPSRRPGSAGEIAERLRSLEERRAARLAEERARQAAEKAHRRRRLWSTVAAVSSVFLVVVSFLAMQAMRARADAERRRGQAEQLIDFMLNDLHEGLDRIGRLNLLAGVAESSKEYFDSLTERDESPDALDKRGTTLQNIGDVMLDEGSTEAALAAQQSAVSLFEGAVALDPKNERWRLGLGLSRLRLGETLAEQGETDAALELSEEARQQLQELAAEAPEASGPRFAVAQAHYGIGALELKIGDMPAALEAGRSAVRTLEELEASGSTRWRESLLLLDALILLGEVHRFDNAPGEALVEMTRARDLAQRLAREDPGNTYWSRRLAVAHELVGTLLYTRGEAAAALDSIRAARTVYQELADTDPTRVEWRERLTENSQLIGYAHLEAGNPDAALPLFREAQAILEKLLEGDPSRVTWLARLAHNHQLIGGLHYAAGELSDAEASMVAAVGLQERVIAASGADPKPRNALSFARVQLGDVYARGGDRERARAEWARAVEIIAPVTAESDEQMYVDTEAQALLRLGRLEEARPLVEDLIARGWNAEDFRQAVRDSGLDVRLP